MTFKRWLLKLIGLGAGVVIPTILIRNYVWDYTIYGPISVLDVIGSIVFWILYFRFIYRKK